MRKRAAAFFPSVEGFCTPVVETDEEGSEKENWDVGKGSSLSVLCPIVGTPSPEPIPTPPPVTRHKLSFKKVSEDLHQMFAKGKETFLSGGGVPWLERQLEGSPELYAGGRGIGYVSEMDVDNFLN